jgi:hypothetical protein
VLGRLRSAKPLAKFRAELTIPTCVNACGNLPRRRLAVVSYFSEMRPTSFMSFRDSTEGLVCFESPDPHQAGHKSERAWGKDTLATL